MMECVKVRFAPGADARTAKNVLQRAIRSVNRLGLWPTLYWDFFAFAEIPAEEEELPDDLDAPELSESVTESAETAAELPESVTESAENAPELPESVTESAENAPELPENITESTDAEGLPEYGSLAIPESLFFCILLCPSISREQLRELAARAEELPGGLEMRMTFSPLSEEETEDFYREALDTCREQLPQFSHVVAPELASACEHLALLLSNPARAQILPSPDSRHEAEAETLFQEALSLYRTLPEKSAVAEACGNLARLLYDAGRLNDAEKLYCEAMDIYRELSRRNNEYQGPLARICEELAACLEERGRPGAAEWFYRMSLDLYRKLAERNAEAYAPRVASACGNLAGLLKADGRAAQAAGFYRVALDTYTRLVQENPSRWEPSLAVLYENLASFEAARSRPAGKALLQSAYLLYQKYPALAAEAERVQAQLQQWE